MTINSTVKINQLFIGNIDAERESQKPKFEELFYNKDNKYKELIDKHKFLIVGRKGTGKTYLARYLENYFNTGKNSTCILKDASNFNLHKLIDLNGRDFVRGEYEIFWKWIILLDFAYSILDSHKFKSFIPFTKLHKLRKFIRNKYPNPESAFKINTYNTSKLKQIKAILSKKNDLLTNSIDSQISESKSTTHIPKEYFENIEYLQSLILSILPKSLSTTIIYDDLDNMDSTTKLDSFYIDLLNALISISYKLNLQFSKTSKSKVILVLREDILGIMQDYNTNLNKITSSNQVRLYWINKDSKTPHEDPLMKLILSKIKKSAECYTNLSDSELYKKLFGKSVKNSSQLKYLLDHSFGRPRDIIKYLNIIQENYGDSDYFKPTHYTNSLKEYSNWFYDELRNEISIRSNSKFLKDSLMLIKNVHKIYFTIDDVKEAYNSNPELYPNITDIISVLDSMYKLGVVGNSYPSRTSANRYYTYFGYRDDAPDEPNFSTTFVIHNALQRKFSLF